MSTRSQWRTASMAAEPVSPLVAPTMVRRSSRSASTWSNSSPTNCKATSLNANVGPWNSSASHWRWSICTSGTTAAWRNDAYARWHRASRSAASMSSPTNGRITAAAVSA